MGEIIPSEVEGSLAFSIPLPQNNFNCWIKLIKYALSFAA